MRENEQVLPLHDVIAAQVLTGLNGDVSAVGGEAGRPDLVERVAALLPAEDSPPVGRLARDEFQRGLIQLQDQRTAPGLARERWSTA